MHAHLSIILFVYTMRITMDSMAITRMNIPGGKNGVFRLESVDCTVIQTQSYNSYTFTSLHNEIQCKIFHEIVTVIHQRLKAKQQLAFEHFHLPMAKFFYVLSNYVLTIMKE